MYGIWRMHCLAWRFIVVVHLHNRNKITCYNYASKQKNKPYLRYRRSIDIFHRARHSLGTWAQLQIRVSSDWIASSGAYYEPCIKPQTDGSPVIEDRRSLNAWHDRGECGLASRQSLSTGDVLPFSQLPKEFLKNLVKFVRKQTGNLRESFTGQSAQYPG